MKRKLVSVPERVDALLEQYGSYRKAAAHTALKFSELWDLKQGKREARSETLVKLGLKPVSRYELLDNV